MPQLIAEARRLLGEGVRELVLVAQDTTAYGQDLDGQTHLADLLQELADLVQDPDPRLNDRFWIRFLYGHPESIDDAVISTVARNGNICSYFDVPIQHAHDRVLKRMGRSTNRDDLYRMIDRIRSRVPEAALRTTVIVGFPGETEKEFRQLLTFIEDIRFAHLGCFTYSDAEDLPSHNLSGHVSKQIAEQRYDELMTLQRRIVGRLNAKYLGKTLPVLIEEKSESGLYVGRTEFQAPEVDGVTFVRARDLTVGQFAATRISEVLEYDLVGEAE